MNIPWNSPFFSGTRRPPRPTQVLGIRLDRRIWHFHGVTSKTRWTRWAALFLDPKMFQVLHLGNFGKLEGWYGIQLSEQSHPIRAFFQCKYPMLWTRSPLRPNPIRSPQKGLRCPVGHRPPLRAKCLWHRHPGRITSVGRALKKCLPWPWMSEVPVKCVVFWMCQGECNIICIIYI
jgi:hypothetical protein